MKISKEIHEVPLKNIKISKLNVRLTDRSAKIDELANSIQKHGLLQPVVLTGTFGNPPYELIVGQRRLLAHQKLNSESIRAVFCGDVSDLELAILSLAENMQRTELNYADKAKAITSLYVQYGRNASRVARELGVSGPTVMEYLKIEELATPKAKEMLKQGRLKKEDAKRVISAAQGDEKKIDKLLDQLPQLTKYEKDRAVSYGKREKAASAEKIIEEGKKPRLERTVILSLSQEMDNALDKAKRQLSMDREAIATYALEKWLKENGFL